MLAKSQTSIESPRIPDDEAQMSEQAQNSDGRKVCLTFKRLDLDCDLGLEVWD